MVMTLLIILAALFQSTFVLGQELPTASLRSSVGEVSQELTELSFQNDELIRFNQNRGSMNAAFSIPLPSSYGASRTKLELRYDSQEFFNRGMGIGFRWSLPEITFDPKNPRAEYIIHHDQSSNELIYKDGVYEELSLSSFVKVKKTRDGFRADYPDGKVRVFDQMGFLVKERPRLSLAWTHFEFKENKLSTITMPNGSKVYFDYKECPQRNLRDRTTLFPFSKGGRWIDATQCLESARYSEAPENVIRFEYSDQLNLKRVFWEAEKPRDLFRADYTTKFRSEDDGFQTHLYTRIDPKDLEVVDEVKKDRLLLPTNTHRLRLLEDSEFNSYFRIHPWRNHFDADRSGEAGFKVFGDYNGDGYQDFFYFSIYHEKRDQSEIDKFFDYSKWHSPKSTPFLSKISGGAIELLPSSSRRHSPKGLPVFGKQLTSGETRYIARRHLISGDFNGDGFDDLISCPRILDDDLKSDDERAYIGLNTPSGFEVSPKSLNEIKCGHKAIAFDLNRDGYTDIITDTAVYLSGVDRRNRKHFFHSLKETPSPLRDLQKQLAKNKERFDYGISDVNRDGIPEKVSESEAAYYIDLDRDGLIEKLPYDGEPVYLRQMPIRPLMSRSYSEFGGFFEVHYSIFKSTPVVTSLSKDPLKNGTAIHQHIDYYGAFFDSETRRFSGFEFVETLLEGSQSREPGRKIEWYYADLVSERNERRTPVQGILRESFWCLEDRCDDLISRLMSPGRLDDTPWEKREFFGYEFFDSERLQDLGLKNPDSRQYFLFNFKKETEWIAHPLRFRSMMEPKIDSKEVKEFQIKRMNSFGVMKIVQASSDSTLVTEWGSKAPLGQTELVKERQVIDGVVFPLREVRYGSDSRLNFSPRRVTQYDYRGSPGSSLFTRIVSEGIAASENQKSRIDSAIEPLWKTKVQLDKHGRVIHSVDHRGEVRKFDYGDIEEPIRETKGTSVTEFTRNSFGLVQEKKRYSLGKGGEGSLTFSFERDRAFRLKRASDGEVSLVYEYDIKPGEHRFFQKSLGEKKSFLDYVTGSEEKLLDWKIFTYNGFGQETEELEWHGGDRFLSLGQKRYDGNGQILSTSLPKFQRGWSKSSKRPDESYIYDAFGRKVFEEIESQDLRIEYFYSGRCKNKYKNNLFISGECKNIRGESEFFKDWKGPLEARIDPMGQVIALEGMTYSYDSVGRLDFLINERLGGRLQNDYGKDQKSGGSSDGFSWKLNSAGKLIETWFKGYLANKFQYDDLERLKKASYLAEAVNVSYQYDNYDQLTSKQISTSGSDYTEETSYLSDGRIKELILNSDTYFSKLQLSFAWEGRSLKSIRPFIENISVDKNGHINEVQYSKEALVSFQFDRSGALTKWKARSGLSDRKAVSERIEYLPGKRVSRKTIYIDPEGSSKRSEFEYDSFQRLAEPPKLEAPQRGFLGRMEKKGLEYYENSDHLKLLEGKAVHYRAQYKLLGLGSEFYLDDKIHVIDDHIVRYIYSTGDSDSRILGAAIFGDDVHGFFPIVTDGLNSVRIIMDSSNRLLVHRSYTAWGEVEKQFFMDSNKAKLVDRLIRFDFAGLKRPYGSKYLFSDTRVYSPQHGEWLTKDPLLLRRPQEMISSNFNQADGFIYANGNPLNAVDTSGTLLCGGVCTGFAMVGATVFGATSISLMATRGAVSVSSGIGQMDSETRVQTLNDLKQAFKINAAVSAALVAPGAASAGFSALGPSYAAANSFANQALVSASVSSGVSMKTTYDLGLAFLQGLLVGPADVKTAYKDPVLNPFSYAAFHVGKKSGDFLFRKFDNFRTGFESEYRLMDERQDRSIGGDSRNGHLRTFQPSRAQ
jgi:RHS repeat-associated protein